MKRMLQNLRWEIVLQYRHGIFLAALAVTLAWSILLAPLDATYKDLFVPFVLFIDLAILGFYFMGSMVLLEKGQKTIQALIITPLRYPMYLVVKMISYALLSLLSSLLLVLIVHGFSLRNMGVLILGVLLNSLIYTLLGFIAISTYDSISEYLVPSWFYLFLTQLPLIQYFELLPDLKWLKWLFLLHPTQGPLYLMRASFVEYDTIQLILSILLACIWVCLLWMAAMKAFNQNILERKKR